jgi:hypothetical protein
VGDTVLGPRFSTAFPRAAINSAYGPWQTQLDLRLDRAIDVAGIKFDLYLWALNVLGTDNWATAVRDLSVANASIYGATGNNSDDGYLDSPEGKTWTDANGGEPAAALRGFRTNNPGQWSIPRQLRLGVRFDLNPASF